MKLSLLVVGVALGCACASAQSIVVPAGMDTTNPGTTTLAWRNSLFRFQMLYDENHFLSQGIDYPILIHRLRYRAGGGAMTLGGDSYTGVTVQMSSSPSDWSSPSTTFASNVGADVTTVFSGTVTSLAAAGTAPNTYIIDIPLAAPFLYDPTAGLDLLIDVDAPNAPLPAGLPTMAASINASHLARRIATTTAGGATGAASYFACVVLMDYTPPPDLATATTYGIGCYESAASFHETFLTGALDLQGTSGNPNSVRLVPNGSGYVVVPGSSDWFTPVSAPLALADDALSAPIALLAPLAYPGGVSTAIRVCSNGFVHLDPGETSASPTPNAIDLLALGPRLAPLWTDLDPSVGGAIHVDLDLMSSALYVTWDQVPQFNNPGSVSTVQLAIHPDHSIEFRYQACQHGTAVVGWSPGHGARDPGGIDISTAMPFVTQAEAAPLALVAVNRPILGANLTLEVGGFPVDGLAGAISVGSFTYGPGVDLGPLGAPGCRLYSSLDVAFPYLALGSPQRLTLGIPTDPALSGLHLYATAYCTGPSSNALGIVTSNGLDLRFGAN